jgi:hypothetical protein
MNITQRYGENRKHGSQSQKAILNIAEIKSCTGFGEQNSTANRTNNKDKTFCD